MGGERSWRNWVCDKCANAYSLRCELKEWPAWALALRKVDGASRETERERVRAGIVLVPLPDDDCD